jgi:hypothetical protein
MISTFYRLEVWFNPEPPPWVHDRSLCQGQWKHHTAFPDEARAVERRDENLRSGGLWRVVRVTEEVLP